VADLCFGNTKELSSFMKEVFSYRFKDTPRYDYLIDLLLDLINSDESTSEKASAESRSEDSTDGSSNRSTNQDNSLTQI